MLLRAIELLIARVLRASSEEKRNLDLSSVVLVVVGPRRHGRRRRGRRGRGGGRAIVRGDRKRQRHGTAPAAGRARDDDVAVHLCANQPVCRVHDNSSLIHFSAMTRPCWLSVER